MTKANLGRLLASPAGFHPKKADDPVSPIDVLGLQICQVRLRGSQMPGELIKRPALRVLFTRDYFAVLLPSDGTFLFEAHCRPLVLGNEWPREPVHGDTKIVQTS